MAPPPKRRRVEGKIKVTPTEKIDFDFSAREEYLTGFHKRKVARQKFAQEEIAKREKEEKLRFRREVHNPFLRTVEHCILSYKLNSWEQLRQQRKVDLEQHVEEVNRLVAQANGEIPALNQDSSEDENSDDADEEFTGFTEPPPINQEDEYIDEDKYTTVTVESVGIDRTGFLNPSQPDELDIAANKSKQDAEDLIKDATKSGHVIQRDANGKRIWTKERPKTEWPKKKKKKFRYESKADRKATRVKEGVKKKKMREKRAKGKEET